MMWEGENLGLSDPDHGHLTLLFNDSKDPRCHGMGDGT